MNLGAHELGLGLKEEEKQREVEVIGRGATFKNRPINRIKNSEKRGGAWRQKAKEISSGPAVGEA